MKKSRKWSLFVGGVAVVAVGAWGLSLNGASSTIDPAKVATVERGTTTRPAVATGKIEPITKVEIKSKANGIFENLFVDVDHLVTPGQVLAELDKENLTARLRDARADLQAAEPARAGALAQLRKKKKSSASSARCSPRCGPRAWIDRGTPRRIGARRLQAGVISGVATRFQGTRRGCALLSGPLSRPPADERLSPPRPPTVHRTPRAAASTGPACRARR